MIKEKDGNKMVRKIDIYVLTIVFSILTIFTATSAAIETTPPASIGDLHTGDSEISYTNVDATFDTGIQTTNNAIVSNVIRFITIGDPHITSNTSDGPYVRLARAVKYINGRSDVDFVVITGDIVDSATTNNFATAKALLSTLRKPYYVVPGNHDLGSSISKFEGYFGPSERVVNMNGYQLIFIGISKDNNGTNHWSFDYSRANKSKPTVIFNHGPVQQRGTVSCISAWGRYYGYSCDMKPNVDSFTKLLGYYNGHVHAATNQLIGKTRYVSSDNLGGNGPYSNRIGYTKIKNSVLSYSTVIY